MSLNYHQSLHAGYYRRITPEAISTLRASLDSIAKGSPFTRFTQLDKAARRELALAEKTHAAQDFDLARLHFDAADYYRGKLASEYEHYQNRGEVFASAQEVAAYKRQGGAA